MAKKQKREELGGIKSRELSVLTLPFRQESKARAPFHPPQIEEVKLDLTNSIGIKYSSVSHIKIKNDKYSYFVAESDNEIQFITLNKKELEVKEEGTYYCKNKKSKYAIITIKKDNPHFKKIKKLFKRNKKEEEIIV